LGNFYATQTAGNKEPIFYSISRLHCYIFIIYLHFRSHWPLCEIVLINNEWGLQIGLHTPFAPRVAMGVNYAGATA